jgi:Na+-transporting methylmalonyl-CoA/oxaloacetate decarboxylase gamma subunit
MWIVIGVGVLILAALILLAIFAENVGRIARVIHPPKPPRRYEETSEVRALRLELEKEQRKLERLKQEGERLRRGLP